MPSKSSRLKLTGLVAFGIASLLLMPTGVLAQGQAIFQDDRQLLQQDQQQIQQFENQVQNYEEQAKQRDAGSDSYRLYAEKRVEELSKLRNAGGSPTKSLAQEKKVNCMHWKLG